MMDVVHEPDDGRTGASRAALFCSAAGADGRGAGKCYDRLIWYLTPEYIVRKFNGVVMAYSRPGQNGCVCIFRHNTVSTPYRHHTTGDWASFTTAGASIIG